MLQEFSGYATAFTKNEVDRQKAIGKLVHA
jgi:hypothetical protein